MMLRLIATSSAFSMALLASDDALTLSVFPDASKGLPQLARESVDRQIAASVQGERGMQLASPLMFVERPRARMLPRASAEVCSIPLLESKVQHPERFHMPALKVPARPMDRMATPVPAPACEGGN